MSYTSIKSGRFQIAFRRLSIVRFLSWVGSVIKSSIILIGDVFIKIFRSLGLLILEIGYGFKLKFVEWKYEPKKEKPQLRSLFFNFFSALWMIPKALLHFISRVLSFKTRPSQPVFKPVKPVEQPVFSSEQRVAELKPSFTWSLVNFVITLLVIVSPIVIYAQWRNIELIKNRVLASGTTAFTNLFSAKSFLEQQNIPEAKNSFSRASQNFVAAQNDLSDVNSFLLELASVIPNKSARLASSGKHLITAGQLSAELGNSLSNSLTLPEGQKPNVSNFINNFIIHAEPSLPLARQLSKEMSKVDRSALPAEYQDQFNDFSSKTQFLADSLEEAIRLAKEANIFLGEKVDKRYMLVFQNNAEKRGPGGFIGSFALVDLRRGEITKLTVPKGGTYDTEAGLSKLVAAPEPLRLLNPRWHFWDANWWPDWPTSARKLMWFYENSNGPSVDGVISLTPTVIERALEIIGPIDMTADYGVVINAENFWTTTQTFSEQKPVVTKEPKKIIGDLINRIMEELPKRLTPEKTLQLIALMEQNLNEKHILAYFNDSQLQTSVERFGWSGEIVKTKKDYLMVIDSNVGGQKTDRIIQETLDHHAKILPDGSIIDTLTVKRAHPGVKGETFIGARNVNWLRVYVPEGSTLISATGFSTPDSSLFESPDPKSEIDPNLEAENNALLDPVSQTKIYDEQGKTVFANWSMVDPGETAVMTFTYRLPFRIDNTPKQATDILSRIKQLISTETQREYSLYVQKQSGAVQTNLRSQLEITNPTPIHWSYPATIEIDNGWQTERPLQTDFFAAILFK